MKDFILAVDPGVSGGMAVWRPEKEIRLQRYTTEDEFIDFVKNLKGRGIAIVEHVPKYIGNEMRASHSFTLGYNVGFETGVIRSLSIPMDLVKPQRWQHGLSNLKGKTGATRKRVLKDHAKRMYPGLKVTLANADALLILDHYMKGECR
jgi:hypothetical protein